jgi:hypothetical protein
METKGNKPTSQIKIPNHLNNTHYPYYYPLSKNSNTKQILEKKRKRKKR